MKVYMDNAATTRVSDDVMRTVMPYYQDIFGNASSVHGYGREAKKGVENARDIIAKALHANKREIYFTAGGTESDNWALIGAAMANKKRGNHIITTAIEHHAVLHTAEWLRKNGFAVTFLPVDDKGFVSVEAFKNAIQEDTILASIMFANNEIGTIQPIEELGAIAKEKGILFHTDAVQAFMQVPIDVEKMHIDMLSISGHKLHAPKGIGALYARKGTKIDNFILGGAQESSRRAGTENVPGIVGLGAAVESLAKNFEERIARVTALRNKLMEGILKSVPYTIVNGDKEKRLPGNCNVSINYIEGESLLLMLDMKDIAASSGSACTSGSLDPSHVLMAIGLEHAIAHGSLRLTLSDMNTDEEVDYVLSELPPIVEKLRAMSPLYPHKG